MHKFAETKPFLYTALAEHSGKKKRKRKWAESQTIPKKLHSGVTPILAICLTTELFNEKLLASCRKFKVEVSTSTSFSDVTACTTCSARNARAMQWCIMSRKKKLLWAQLFKAGLS